MCPPLDFPSLRMGGAAAVSDRVQMGQLGDQQHGHPFTAQQSHLTRHLVSAQTPPFFTAVQADGPEFAPHLNALYLYSVFTFIPTPSELALIQPTGRGKALLCSGETFLFYG